MAEVAARTWIHRGDELKAGRKRRLARGTRDMYFSRLERLAKDLEHLAIPFRKLVEKQNAMMGERDLARPRIASAADQRHRGRRVMRRPIRPAAPILMPKAARERLYRSRLERFLLRHGRQQSRKPLRKHRFSGAGRPEHQQAVSARRRDLERAFRVRLAMHIGKIERFEVGPGD